MTTRLPDYLVNAAREHRYQRAKAAAQKPHEATKSLLAFTKYTFPEYEVNWHHEILCQRLEAFARGEIKRLMVFMPPRHGKSELVSLRLPAFIFGINPNARIIATSYSADLAGKVNRDLQRIMDSGEYQTLFPDTRLNGANVRTFAQGQSWLRNSDIFQIVNHRGMYRSAGVGGGIVGMGMDFGIIDDPIRNRKDANSETYRESTWDWFRGAFYTRQEKNAGILLTVTRWHLDDVAGRILALVNSGELPEQWEVIDFPAIAEEKRHPLDIRSVGEPLWENKYNLAALGSLRRMVGEYEWNSQYQQKPVPSEGGLFKREKLNLIDHEPYDIVRKVRFWDLALSSKTSADYSVGVLMGITKSNRFVVLDVARFQVDWDDVVSKIEGVAIKDGRTVRIGVETAFFQAQAVRKLLQRPALFQFVINGYKVDTDKFTRALPFAARVGEDMVDVLRSGFTGAYIDEMCSFPLGANDDQVDASSGGYAMLDGNNQLEVKTKSYIGN
jgi:predicted phage terminase large subunit-like protein